MSSEKIKSFRNLEVYQNTYNLSIRIAKEVLPLLPPQEKFDLRDQLSRSTKAIPRLIAEGHGKKHQKAGFQKYLDDTIAECNETIVSLEHCKDLYNVDKTLIAELVDQYDKSTRQIYNLRKAWDSFSRIPKPWPFDVTIDTNEKRRTN